MIRNSKDFEDALKCTFLSLYLRGKDFSFYFQVGKCTYKLKVFTPEKYQTKEKTR